MRINQYIAHCTGKSRRQADRLISSGAVTVNGNPSQLGQIIKASDRVSINGSVLTQPNKASKVIRLFKPTGYVCSRDGQGSKTVYDLLPGELRHLKLVGRLDKDSSGLVLLTDDGNLIQALSHPSNKTSKQYNVRINTPLKRSDFLSITGAGVNIGDQRPSSFLLAATDSRNSKLDRIKSSEYAPGQTSWRAVLLEGRNRQIRKTFAALGYSVIELHRTYIGTIELGKLQAGAYETLPLDTIKV